MAQCGESLQNATQALTALIPGGAQLRSSPPNTAVFNVGRPGTQGAAWFLHLLVTADGFPAWLRSRCQAYASEWEARGSKAAPGSPLRFHSFAMARAFTVLSEVRAAAIYLAKHYHDFADTHATLLHSASAADPEVGVSNLSVVSEHDAVCEVWLQSSVNVPKYSSTGLHRLTDNTVLTPSAARSLARQWLSWKCSTAHHPFLARPGGVVSQAILCPAIAVDPERALCLCNLVADSSIHSRLATAMLTDADSELLRGVPGTEISDVANRSLLKAGFVSLRAEAISQDLARVLGLATLRTQTRLVDSCSRTAAEFTIPDGALAYAAPAGLLRGGDQCGTALLLVAGGGVSPQIFMALDTGEFAPISRGGNSVPQDASVLVFECAESPPTYAAWVKALNATRAPSPVLSREALDAFVTGPQLWRMALALRIAGSHCTESHRIAAVIERPDDPSYASMVTHAIHTLRDTYKTTSALRTGTVRATALRRRMDSVPGSIERLTELRTTDSFHESVAESHGHDVPSPSTDSNGKDAGRRSRKKQRRSTAGGMCQIVTASACGPERPVDSGSAFTDAHVTATADLISACASHMQGDVKQCDALIVDMAVHMRFAQGDAVVAHGV